MTIEELAARVEALEAWKADVEKTSRAVTMISESLGSGSAGLLVDAQSDCSKE